MQGDALAQNSLGGMYATGQGVAQDYVAAHMWADIATANGNEDARVNRDSIAGRMTANEIAEAQRRATVCMGFKYYVACD